MLQEIIFLIVSFIVCWRGVHPFLDIDELKNIHYDIDIIDQPVLFGRSVQEEVIYMKSKYGQRYECKLPDIADVEVSTEEEKMATEIGVSDLLKPMETAPCLRKTKDWWSYDFCYGRKIEQFHLDNDKLIGDKVVLGIYDSETDWSDNATPDSKKHRFNRYHSHNYVNGSKCDLNGQPRQTEVRFHCAEGEGDSIARIDEPSTCTYILTIHTTKICHHPYLKLPPKVKPKSVLCSPALNQDQFETYHYYEEQARLQSVLSSKKENQEDAVDDDAKNDILSHVDDELLQNKAELKKILDNYSSSISVNDIDVILAMGVDPHLLASILEKVVTNVQGSLDSINKEIGEDMEKEEVDSEDVDGEDDEDEDSESQDYRDLVSDFRNGINEMGISEDEAHRLQALADNLEESFEFVEAADKLFSGLDEEQVADGAGKDKSTEDNSNKNEDADSLVEEGDNHVDEGGNHADKSDNLVDAGDNREEINQVDGGEKLEREEVGETDVEEDEPKDTNEIDADAEEKLVKRIKDMIKNAINDPKKGTEGTKKLSLETDGDAEDLDDRVKVRITRINMNKQKGTDPSVKEVKLYDTEHNRLEETIQDHLEQSGIQVEGGGRIELKVLTYTDDWPGQEGEDDGVAILSEDEATYFKNIVSGLLGSQGRMEEEQHSKLENSYHFHWNTEGHRVLLEQDISEQKEEESEE